MRHSYVKMASVEVVMIREEGIVQRVFSGKAIVKVHRHAACEHCDSRGACDIFEGKEMEVEVINELGAEEGDRVEVSVPGGSLLKLSLLVYFIPIVALIVGASIGNFLGPIIGVAPALGAIAVGGASMAVTYWTLKRMDKLVLSTEAYSPRITKVLSSSVPMPQICDNK